MKSISITSLANWCFVALLGLGQLQAVTLSWGARVYLHDIYIVLWLAWWLWPQLHLWLQRRNHQNINAYFAKRKYAYIPALLLILALAHSLLYALFTGQVISLLYAVRLCAYAMFGVLFGKHLARQNRPEQFLFAPGIVLLLGLAQYLVLPDTRLLFILGWDDHYYRLISTLFDPAFTGMFILLGLLYAFGVHRWWMQQSADLSTHPSAKNKRTTRLFIFATFVASLAVLLTFSRTSALILGISLVYMLRGYFSKKQLAALLLIASITLVAIAQILTHTVGGEGVVLTRSSTITARQVQLQKTAQMVLDEPRLALVGTGLYNTTPTSTTARTHLATYNNARTSDNIIVLILISFGAPLGGVIIGLTAIWLFWVHKKLPVWSVAVLLVIIHAQYNNTLLQPFIWLYLSIGYGWFAHMRKQANGPAQYKSIKSD